MDGLIGLGCCTDAEQFDRFGLGEGKHRVLDLSSHPKQLPARDEELEVGAGLDQRGERGRRLDHLLEIVEQKQELALADMGGEAVSWPPASERSCRRRAPGPGALQGRPRRPPP
jgi:hypothetical protein